MKMNCTPNARPIRLSRAAVCTIVLGLAAAAPGRDRPPVVVDLTEPADPASAPAAALTKPAPVEPARRTHVNISDAAIEDLHKPENDRLWRALANVQDKNTTLDEPAFYMMLRLITERELLRPEEREEAFSPAYKALKANPAGHRGQLVKYQVSIHAVAKLLPGSRDFPGDKRHWPKDQAVWRMLGLVVRDQTKVLRPLILYSVKDPTELLGEPDTVDEKGIATWANGRWVEMIGVFYKLLKAQSVGDENRRPEWWYYPVLLVWQIESVAAPPSVQPSFKTVLIVTTVLLLALLFIIMKRYMRQFKKGQPQALRHKFQYRPRRDEPEDGPDKPADQAKGLAVDPELRAAVETYLRQKDQPDADAEDSPD